MNKSLLITLIVVLCLVVILLFIGFRGRENTDNKNEVIELQNTFTKSGTFSTQVDQQLINKGIDYVKDYYVSLAKNDYPEVDVEKTKLNYNCEYTKPAKDDEYLYLNLTCIGDVVDANGEFTDAVLSNFSENPTRLKYRLINHEFVFSEMLQPISPKVYNESLPQEYTEMLEK